MYYDVCSTLTQIIQRINSKDQSITSQYEIPFLLILRIDHKRANPTRPTGKDFTVIKEKIPPITADKAIK